MVAKSRRTDANPRGLVANSRRIWPGYLVRSPSHGRDLWVSEAGRAGEGMNLGRDKQSYHTISNSSSAFPLQALNLSVHSWQQAGHDEFMDADSGLSAYEIELKLNRFGQPEVEGLCDVGTDIGAGPGLVIPPALPPSASLARRDGHG